MKLWQVMVAGQVLIIRAEDEAKAIDIMRRRLMARNVHNAAKREISAHHLKQEGDVGILSILVPREQMVA